MLVIAIGVVYLMFNLDILPQEWRPVVFSWRALLILIGVIGICNRHYISGLITMAAGIIFILPKLSGLLGFYYSASLLGSIVWPSIIILLGLSLILHPFSRNGYHHYWNGNSWSEYVGYEKKRSGHKRNYGAAPSTEKTETDDENGSDTNISGEAFENDEEYNGKVDYNYMFSGADEVFLSPVFRGGDINTFCGGVKLDLRKTSLPKGNTFLEINSICGGVTLIVPRDWAIEIKETSFLGKFVDNRGGNAAGPVNEKSWDNESEKKAGRLIIKASSIMGGGEIRC
jgi:hypothetical protein